MSFKEAISQRIISDYKIPTIAVSDERVARVIKENRILNLRLRDLDEAEAGAVAAGVALKRVEKQGVTAPCARTPSRCVPHVDDLVQPRTEQISRSCRLVLLRPHRSLRCSDRIMLLDSRESRKRNCKLQGLRHGNLAISSQQSRQKTTLAQSRTSFSRATNKPSTSYDDRAASGQSKQAAHARSAKVKPLHATLARRALLRLDSMAAPDPHSMGVPRPQFPRLCPACLPRYPLQTI